MPADLERISVGEALGGSAFDPASPAIVSFLGVTYYLTPETLAESARSIATSVAPGSRLVLDYMLDGGSAWPQHRRMRTQLEDYVARRGEPMKSDYSLAAMSELLADAGFRTLEGVTMMDLAERYAEELGPLPFRTRGSSPAGYSGPSEARDGGVGVRRQSAVWRAGLERRLQPAQPAAGGRRDGSHSPEWRGCASVHPVSNEPPAALWAAAPSRPKRTDRNHATPSGRS